MARSMPVVQIAITALDIDATAAWYRDVLGFLPSGELRGIGGAEVAAFVGLPTCNCDLVWLVDTSDFFQVELFRFHDPVSVPGDRCPNELGWSLIGLYVDDLDEVLARLRNAGAAIGPVLGNPPERRVCTRDPEGVWLELRERAPGGRQVIRNSPVTTGFVRAVVSDLARAREFFVGVLGLRDRPAKLHTAADETLWGAPANRSQSAVLATDGDPFCIELVQYETTDRPLSTPARICDQGILNIALGSRVAADYESIVNRVQHSAFGLHAELVNGSARGRYSVGPGDLSVELLTIPDPALEQQLGFIPQT
jgi:catechol 2,3-dioxygenase-like lactoylglutathione lyase family enzyme